MMETEIMGIKLLCWEGLPEDVALLVSGDQVAMIKGDQVVVIKVKEAIYG